MGGTVATSPLLGLGIPVCATPPRAMGDRLARFLPSTARLVFGTLDHDSRIPRIPLTHALFEGFGDIVGNRDEGDARRDLDRADLMALDAAPAADLGEETARGRAALLAPADEEARELIGVGARRAAACTIATFRPTTPVETTFATVGSRLRRVESDHWHRLTGRFGLREIQQRRHDLDRIAILEGLEEGEMIISAGVNGVQEGLLVRPMQRERGL